jgi:hypothetical protein
MTRSTRLIVGGLVLVLLLVAWFLYRSRSADNVAIDLVAQFPTAKIKRPDPAVFEVIDASLGGERMQAIYAKQPSRLGFSITVPQDAWVKVNLGLKEEAWTMQGDGVLFMIGVSTGTSWSELFSLVVNPFGNPSDKGWKEITVDLSQYAGQTVDLIFNTYSSPGPSPGQPPRDDRNGDMALWGNPRVVVR